MSTFKQLENSLKPREKLKHGDINKLSDAELLAIILCSGTKGSDVLDVAHKLLLKCNGLSQMQTWTIDDFQSIRGIGEVKAITLYTISEISKRANLEKFYIEKEMITKPQQVFELCRPMINYTQEKLVVICLNIRMELIAKIEVYTGSISSIFIQPREIFKTVFMKNAYAFILVHNHPSGYSIASEEDISCTKVISDGAKILNILFIDHIIVAQDGYYSIRSNNCSIFD